jgi:WASH complex subunit strumpellin
MEETMFGDLKMNPQQLLEEGLRRELVRQISMALHTNLQFSLQTDRSRKSLLENQQAFVESLQVLARRMEGFHRTIVWLQDFLRIDGLSIYVQESTRVIWHSV